MKALYFITGSSGSGKTTLLKGVVNSIYPDLKAHHFDDIGVPSIEEMNERYGGPAQWQVHATRQWFKKLASDRWPGLVVLEGQTRPSVIFETAAEMDISPVHVTLIDCSHAERQRRLIDYRVQPELDHPDMYMWAAYLRGQADALKLEVIDTTTSTKTEATHELAKSIGRFANENGMVLKRAQN